MSSRSAPGSPGAGAGLRSLLDVRLRGRSQTVARVVCVGVLALVVALVVAAIPGEFAAWKVVCTAGHPPEPGCWQYLTPKTARDLQSWGLTTWAFAAYFVALAALESAVSFTVAAVIFWRKPGERMALFCALTLLTVGAAFPHDLDQLQSTAPFWQVPARIVELVSLTSVFVFFYIFPDGHFVPRWTRWLAAAAVLNAVYLSLPTASPIALPILFSSILVAQVYRYRQVSDPVQRRQTKWIMFGVTVALTGFVGIVVASMFAGAELAQNLVATILINSAVYLLMTLIPLSIGIAILRSGLWDIDIIISRTLVYGALTAGVVGLYVLVVGYLGTVLRTGNNLGISLVATGLVAVAFQPLREYLQRGVNHLIYGERDDPYTVISRLGQRLETTLSPDAVLPAIVETVAQALKLPYAAIALAQDEGYAVVAAVGSPVDAPVMLPLVYQQEMIGQLLLGPRTPGEPFSLADRQLLDDLARQAGIAAHAVRLTADLQRSRERLVTAREEERRRLRRDLHDGLGPAMAAQTLKVGAARSLYPHDPAEADALLVELERDMKASLADVRRLVYNLRPPALDELGLVGAIRDSVALYPVRAAGPGDGEGLGIVVDTPGELPPLPAAVEVAAYRIVQEALANVVRHAQAHRCRIGLQIVPDGDGTALEVLIVDDGSGLPTARQAGVGLTSMRERAAELGGRCLVETLPEGGARVCARLPVPSRTPDSATVMEDRDPGERELMAELADEQQKIG